jgi:hypothetical protein
VSFTLKEVIEHNRRFPRPGVDLGAGGGVESRRHAGAKAEIGCREPGLGDSTARTSQNDPSESSASPARPISTSYNPKLVLAFLEQESLPLPVFEYQFALPRKWRFDLAWPDQHHRLALEVQGGIFSQGRHTRGPALLKEWEKLNRAASMGWRIVFVQPKDLCTLATARLIKRCLAFEGG